MKATYGAVLVIVATLAGIAGWAIARHWTGRAGAPRTEEAIERSRWARRLDPDANWRELGQVLPRGELTRQFQIPVSFLPAGADS